MKARVVLGISVIGLAVLLAAAVAAAHSPTATPRVSEGTRSSESAGASGSGPIQGLSAARLQSDARRDGLKEDHKRDKSTPGAVQPPSTEPTSPQTPPAEPDPAGPPTPPVEPDPTGPPAAPGAVTGIACTSGNMMDHIEFRPPVDGGPVQEFRLLSAPTSDGAYSRVASAGVDGLSFTVSMDATATAFYRVVAVGPGGEGAASEAVANSHVSIMTEVAPSGGTIRSSNGEMTLAFPAGSVASTTTVTVEEVEGTPVGGIISLAGVYDLSSSAPLVTPVRLSVAYTINVTHFQVSAAMLSQADLMTYDAAAGTWVHGASNVQAREGMLSGDLPHFSYWSGGVVQPHGTSTTAYCSDGGICHNLSAYPGTLTRLSGKDPQVCFNCHGSSDLTTGPAGASGENVQAAMQGAGSLSSHPVAIGDLACTSCHDPHANPVTSPGLLRVTDVSGSFLEGGLGVAPGTEFCWACHGAVSNRRIAYLVPSYWQNAGGDKKTGFNGAHTALGTATWRYDSEGELSRGYTSSSEVRADGTVAIAGTIALPKTPAMVTASHAPWNGGGTVGAAYDGNPDSYPFFYAKDIGAAGATGASPKVGAFSLTIDLGAPTPVRGFDCYYIVANGAGLYCADVLEVQTSDDNTTWRSIAADGTIGVRLPNNQSISASDTCRYVRFVFSRQFDGELNGIGPAEITIHGAPTVGTYEVWPDIARNVPYSGGVVKWGATQPASTSVAVVARASVNSGSTWTEWLPVTNGAAFTQIPAGASLENARLQVRATLSGSGTSPTLDWLEVNLTRGAIVGTTPQWSGDSPANLCARCHTSHGSAKAGLVAEGSSAACTTCHSTAYGSSYAGPAEYAGSVHAAVACADCHTAHGKSAGTGVTYAFLLKGGRPDVCLECHSVVKDAFDANQGVASEWAKHDMYSAEQVKSGSSLACRNCHGTHASSTGLVNPDNPAQAFTTLRDDPTTIPTQEVVIYASKDTVLDSANPSLNYGASPQVAISGTANALLYFDLSTLPANVVIQNATLVLWPSNPDYHTYVSNYCQIFPVTRNWAEGSGTGTPNDATVNGATWDSWQFGSGWTTPGGDVGAVSGPATQGHARNVTTLVRSLYQGPNYGIMVAKLPGYPAAMPIYMDEYSTGTNYSPHLRIVYQTGPASPEKIVDDATFCLTCHDASMPLGLKGQAGISQIASNWNSDNSHGKAKGIGPESDILSFSSADPGGGSLRAPYSYGMDALPCTTCHDPHGSRLPYHLKQVINGRDMTPVFSEGWDYLNVSQERVSAWFCGACHIYPPGHASYEGSTTATCIPCHRGGH